MIQDTPSPQISQKQDEHNIYVIMKTMGRAHCFHDNIYNMSVCIVCIYIYMYVYVSNKYIYIYINNMYNI